MNKNKLFFNLIITDIRRLKHYIPSLLVSVIILLAICTTATYAISKHIYKEGDYTTVKVGYYIPEDNDYMYTNFATGMLSNMKSMQESAVLCEVDSIEEGYRMLDNLEILYFIIVPENFFSGIIDGTNPKLDIIVRDNTAVTSYITNELFLSYASYLSTAQSAIYSMLDTVRLHNFSEEQENLLKDKLNLVFIERTLNKNGYINTIEATGEGSFSLGEFYVASAIAISLLLMSIILMPLLCGKNNGTLLALSIHKVNNIHIFVSNFITAAIAVYIAFIPCYIVSSILVAKSLNLIGLISVIPAIFVIAFVISLSAFLGKKSLLAANMIALGFTMVLLYSGGGLIPHAMLPQAIQNISNYLPGEFIIDEIAAAIFKV